jgi:hypothetical protein
MSKKLKSKNQDFVLKFWASKKYKVTVEEVTPEKYIATFWDKDFCLEVDRNVFEFETYGGATDKAFNILASILDEVPNE